MNVVLAGPFALQGRVSIWAEVSNTIVSDGLITFMMFESYLVQHPEGR